LEKSKIDFFFILNIISLFLLTGCVNNGTKNELNISEENRIKTTEEFDHIMYIRNKSNPEMNNGDVKPKYLVDYVIEELLEKTEYKKYISDRSLLRKLKNKVCWNNYVLISDTLSNGESCKIEIKTKDFITNAHNLEFQKSTDYLISVDNKYPYGAVYSKSPKKELNSLEIKINGKRLDTNIYKYKNLYEVEFCNFGGYRRIAEAYEDGENIYIYLNGGNAADSYFAKLVFNRSGYVTSIVADYSPLSDYGSFGEGFIGF